MIYRALRLSFPREYPRKLTSDSARITFQKCVAHISGNISLISELINLINMRMQLSENRIEIVSFRSTICNKFVWLVI